MINGEIGAEVRIDGRLCARVEAGRRGYAIYGPYEQVGPGEYRIDYFIRPEGRSLSGKSGCIRLDVTADCGRVTIAEREVRIADIQAAGEIVSVFFKLTVPMVLEYRAHVDGKSSLSIGNDPLVSLSGQAGQEDMTDLPDHTDDPEEMARQVRSVLRFLRPHIVKGYSKRRFGRAGDGGYICIDDFEGVDVALSLGINDEISWDKAVADKGLIVYQFDHTVEDPAPDDHRMVFAKKMIAVDGGEGTEDLENLVKLHDKGLARPNIFLKMDIECGEWSVLEAISQAALGRFSQITCELHAFQNLADLEWRGGMYRALRKLHDAYALVHVHGNNHSGFSNIFNVIVPNVIEATFVNRAMYAIEESDELFPGALDIACDSECADLFLGSFRF